MHAHLILEARKLLLLQIRQPLTVVKLDRELQRRVGRARAANAVDGARVVLPGKVDRDTVADAEARRGAHLVLGHVVKLVAVVKMHGVQRRRALDAAHGANVLEAVVKLDEHARPAGEPRLRAGLRGGRR